MAPEEQVAEFRPAGEKFATSSRCHEYLAELTSVFPQGEYETVRGPYPVFENDVRIHALTARGGQYVVVEYRCFRDRIEARSWAAGPAAQEPKPFTFEDIQAMTFPTELGKDETQQTE